MLRYFFTGLIVAVVAIVSIAGFRGAKSNKAPLEVFPDMDRQPRFDPQHKSEFFADSRAARQHVDGTVPRGFVNPGTFNSNQGNNARNLTGDAGFSIGTDYLNTGIIGEVWGKGIPMEVNPELLARGKERFKINCSMCHGIAGDGQGIISKYGLGGIANFHDSRLRELPEGAIFDTITHGKGNMAPHGPNITVEDRWAIIAYVRALQRSQNATLADVPAEHRTELEKQ